MHSSRRKQKADGLRAVGFMINNRRAYAQLLCLLPRACWIGYGPTSCVRWLDTSQDVQELATGNDSGKASDIGHTNLLHPGADCRTTFSELRSRVAAAMPRQFHEHFCR